MNKSIFYILIFTLLISCSDETAKKHVLIKYKGKEYPVPPTQVVDANDSASLRKKAKELALQEILYDEALSKIGDDPDLEEKITNYRKKLYIHELEKKIIEYNLDTAITEKELQAYYAAHSEDFLLNEAIVKIIYIRVPHDNKNLKKIQQIIKNLSPDKEKELYDLASLNATAFTDLKSWVYLDDVRKNIAFLKNTSDDYLTAGKTFEFYENNEWVYCKIMERKNRNTVSPFGMVRNRLKEIVLKEKARLLLEEYRKQLLEEAIQKKDLYLF
ncbi:MAG: hypothetical protein N3F09_09175 [Bacteroidia bacterium]|nr:hypothetical protein [Bacteroidia bacterium]